MKRTLLLTLSLVACGDDSSSQGDAAAGANDGSQATQDASRSDAASVLLDASMSSTDAGEPEPDASVTVDASASLDARTLDATADAQQCAAEGERCGSGGSACCEGNACVTTSDKPYDVCARSCSADSECESGCCSSNVCAALDACEEDDATAPLTGISCFGGLSVYSHSGTYLGRATAKPLEDDSVCEPFGPYGKFDSGAPNMWDLNSDAYQLSIGFSAILGCGSDFPVLAYVSKYGGASANGKRVIDPDVLCDVLRNSNL